MQEPPDHALDRSRGGFSTKVHLVCDSHGMVVAIHVTADVLFILHLVDLLYG